MAERLPAPVSHARRARVTSRATESAIWADEVAIDFPSVRVIAARVRDAFVDEEQRPARVVADVSLTPDQAREGVELPLLVSRNEPCPRCGGRGERFLEPCHGCFGCGERTSTVDVVVTIPPHVADGESCRATIPGTRGAVVTLRVRVPDAAAPDPAPPLAAVLSGGP